MAKRGYLSARIDDTLKADAERVLGHLGLTSAQALTLFFQQVVLRQGIPFAICIPNEATRAAMAELDAGGGTPYATSADAFDAILKGSAKAAHETPPRRRAVQKGLAACR
jgi:DNA-damage-inducible protein J